jgi:hypothetical protein
LGTLVRDSAAARTKNVTGVCAIEGAVTVTALTPADAGRRTQTSARPDASLVAEALDSCTPGEAAKVTGAPETGAFEASSSATRSGRGSAEPGMPV